MSSGETLPPAIMDALLSVIWRLEARLEASEQRLAMANTAPRPEPEFDSILGRPLTSWDLPRPRISPELCSNHSYSESYGGGGGYSNNYESQAWSYNNYESQAWSYNNYESQAWPYNTYEPYHYNHVPQPVQYEPPSPAQYYSVAEPPPQQRHYYPPTPSYSHVTDVDATLEADVNDSETRGESRRDVIVADPPLEEIGEEESTTMADPKLEEADAEKESSKEEHVEALGGDAGSNEVDEDKSDFMASDSGFGIAEKNDKVGEEKEINKCASVQMLQVPKELPNFKVEDIPAEACFKLMKKKGDFMEEVLLEVSRRLVIFGLYALAEVYKDLHLEDKVVFKGGGVDTYIL